MYTVTLTKDVNQSNQKVFTLTYTNGTNTFEETFLWDSVVACNAMALNRIKQLEAYDALTEGAFTPVES